jgi:hypothetical protein
MKKNTFIFLCLLSYTSGILADTKDNPLTEAFPISKVVVGQVDNAADFSGSVIMHYDADSVYMQYIIADDSIVNYPAGTNSYMVDNIEIYFDMDNSKTIHWPRNGNWLKEIDDTYDLNDYQLRLVPGVPFLDYNLTRPSDVSITDGYRVVYNLTDTGYNFIFNIAWNRLLDGFDATVGKRIGFDVLASDNDKYASVEFRNQITWNCTTDKPYNDPSLFGTLELAEGGVFTVIPDTTAPSEPGNFAAKVDSNQITFTWDASTDNIAVLQYTIYRDDDSLISIYGIKTGNKFVLRHQANGTHAYKVSAFDNYGNRSDISPAVEATVDYTPTGINNTSANRFINYPNPVDNSLNIDNASTIVMVELLGINGSVISTTANRAAGQIVLNTSGLDCGIYLLRLTTTDGQVMMSKIVKV